MQAAVDALIAWFALPQTGLGSVFIIALISATLLPLGSEPAVFAYAKLHPEQFWVVVAVATAGNTLGGMIDYWLGYAAKVAVAPDKQGRYLRWLERFGPRTMFVSFLPVIGDPLCTLGGWVKLPFWPSVGWMALGKALRYTVMTAGLLWVPDSFWKSLLRPFLG